MSTLYIIAYDITANQTSDKRRAKIHKTLCAYGQWTQYSLFECFLSEKQYLELRARLEKYVAATQDSVRFYSLCKSCHAKVETIGKPPPQEPILYLV